jgi:hypothetical protein
MNFKKKILFLWVIFALLDPDPDSEYGSGSTDPVESGSNPDPDTDPYPDPQPCFKDPKAAIFDTENAYRKPPAYLVLKC